MSNLAQNFETRPCEIPPPPASERKPRPRKRRGAAVEQVSNVRPFINGNEERAPSSERKKTQTRPLADQLESYMDCVTDHLNESRDAIAVLFQACASLFVLADSDVAPRALEQWDNARAAFTKGSEFLALAAHDLSPSTLRDYFDGALVLNDASASQLSHAAEE